MILAIGSDIVQISRIQRLIESYGERFQRRIFTEGEISKAYTRRNAGPTVVAATLAKRFAAKEAMLKAAGTGLSDGITWHDIEVINDEKSGRPHVIISGKTKQIMEKISGGDDYKIHISLSDDGDYAQAFIVISKS